VSLTSHLRDRTSNVRAFFELRLPNTPEVVKEANRALRDGRDEPELAGTGVAWLVATAADVLLNAWLEPAAPPAWPALAIDETSEMMRFHSERAVQTMFAERPESLSSAQSEEVVRHGLLLATLVGVARSPNARAHVAERLAGASASLDDYARRLWTAADEEDLRGLMPAVLNDHRSIRASRRIAVNPTFMLSAALGGADADLVADRVLWDYKATGQTRIVRREEIWQILGYALADSINEFEIDSVGISALRWRRKVQWQLVDLLAQLSGDGRTPVSVWRREFEGLFTAPADGSVQARRRAIRQARADVERRARELWEPTIVRIWMRSANAHLDGKRPIDLVRDGRCDEVLAAIDAAIADGYA
jgi:hypothetical protein